jgi:hypothetical protein
MLNRRHFEMAVLDRRFFTLFANVRSAVGPDTSKLNQMPNVLS